MTQTVKYRRLAAALFSSALVFVGTPALGQEQSQGERESGVTSYLDLEAGLGYSSNAGLRFDSESSVFGRISATGIHSWANERGVVTLRGYIENTSYLRHYGSKQLWSLGASASRTLSQTVSVYGDVGFSGDFGGQLSNRLLYDPGNVVVDPANPLPDPSINPDLFGISGRQYRLTASAGASIRSSSRSTVSLSAGAAYAFSSGGNKDADYTTYNASGAYSQQVSERTNAGVSLTVARQDFRRGGWSNTVNPALFASTRLSEELTADGSIGIMRIYQRVDGDSEHSTALSFSGGLCNQTDASRFCGRVSRNATTGLSSGVIGGRAQAAITTSASLSYWRKLGPNDSLQASLSASRYRTAAAIEGDDFKTTYFSGVIGYDRNIGARLYGGVQGGARKLFQSGPDPDVDFNATVYLRYRLGDL